MADTAHHCSAATAARATDHARVCPRTVPGGPAVARVGSRIDAASTALDFSHSARGPADPFDADGTACTQRTSGTTLAVARGPAVTSIGAWIDAAAIAKDIGGFASAGRAVLGEECIGSATTASDKTAQ